MGSTQVSVPTYSHVGHIILVLIFCTVSLITDAHVLKNAMEGLLLGTVTSRSKHGYWSINPLTPTSDQDRIACLHVSICIKHAGYS